MSKIKKITFINLILVLCLLSIVVIFICPSTTTKADSIDNNLEINIIINSDSSVELKCNNVKNWLSSHDSDLIQEVKSYITTYYPLSASIKELLSFLDDKESDNYQDDFIINLSISSINDSLNGVSTYATSNDLTMINEIFRVSELDRDGYIAYSCNVTCKWDKAPINRFKDILVMSIVSNTQPIYGTTSASLMCYSNSGLVIYNKGESKIQEYSLPGTVGFKYDLPGDVILGGVLYRKFTLELGAAVYVKETFNMYGAYGHRIIVGSPSMSFNGVSFSVNTGTDLFTKTSTQFV